MTVTDDYRWLQNWNDPAVREWSEKENAYARQFLDHLPNVPALRRRVTEIMEAKTISYGGVQYRKGQLFALKRQPPKQQPMLIVLPSAQAVDQARVLVDPNAMDAKGGTIIDWFVPSADGKLLAVSLSHGGTESGDVHIFDVADRQTDGRSDPPGQLGDRRWRSGLDRRWQRLLLHAAPPCGRAAGRRSRFLSADLFPQAGHADRVGPL